MNYEELIEAGPITVNLERNEKALLLKLYDYGVCSLTEVEVEKLNIIIAKMKDQIWP